MSAFPERRLSIVTLGCRDRTALKAFYEGVLGFVDVGPPQLTVFDMGGFALCLWERDRLAEDAGLADEGAPAGFKGFTLAYNARSRAEVDTIFAALTAAGASVSKMPHEVFWGGYSGYFTDPEGHAWEVAFNPFWPVGPDGRLSFSPASA